MAGRPLDRDDMYFNLGDPTNKIVETLMGNTRDIETLKGLGLGNTAGDLTAIKSTLAKKVYYSSTVATMKADTGLKEGDLVVTTGFYQDKDGGGATYQVTKDAADGYFVHSLPGGLSATLVVPSNNSVSIRQIGGRPQDLTTKYDNKPYIDAYLARLDAVSNRSYRFKLYIPSGIWCFSPTTIHRYRGFSITGDFNFSHSGNGMEGTVINAMTDNQDFVWMIGNGTAVMYGFELGNFTMSASNFRASGANLVLDTNYTVNKQILGFQGVGFGYVKPIMFAEALGTAFDITSSWEITFDKLIYRGVGVYTKPVMNFSPLLASLSAYNPNLSNLVFDTLDFEVTAGHLINFKVGSYLLNSEIKTIVVEAAVKGSESVKTVSDATYNDATATKMSIINIEGEFNGNAIGSIIVNNFAWHLATKNSVQYVYDTIVSTPGNLYPITFGIDQISIVGLKKDYNIILQTSATQSPSSLGKAYFGRIDNGITSYKGIFNVKRFPSIKVSDMRYPDISYDGTYLSPSLTPFHEIATHVNIAGTSYPGTLCYDVDTLNKMALALYVRKWATGAAATVARFMNEAGKKVSIRAKIQNAVPVTFILSGKVGGVDTTVNVPLTGTGVYKWYDLLTSAANTFDDMTYVTISAETDKDAYLDLLRYS